MSDPDENESMSVRPSSDAPLAALMRQRVAIIRDTFLVTAAIAGGSFLLPNRYTATASLLPPRSTAELAGAVLGLPEVSAISRSLGLDASSETSIYLGVLKSGTVRGSLVRRFDLATAYHQRDPEKVVHRLTDNTGISLSSEGLIRVSVTDRDARRAADLANAYVTELDSVLQHNTNVSARSQREFLGRRVAECRADLTKAEDGLRDYEIRTRLPAAGLDTEKSAESVAELMAQKAQREVELGTLESVSRGPSPRMEELRNEIEQIENQVIKLPPAATELSRLVRELKIQEKILLVLVEEYERARILEQKDISVVQVLDQASPPLHKSSPKRALIAVVALLVVFVTRSTLVILVDRARRTA
jgi:tyrosine-protein kinase Etk/Wzc